MFERLGADLGQTVVVENRGVDTSAATPAQFGFAAVGELGTYGAFAKAAGMKAN